MFNLTADKARQITERSSQRFESELLDEIESDIIREASKGYNEVVTTKFLHTGSFTNLKIKYREDLQNLDNQLAEAGYKVDVKETAIGKFDFRVDANVKVVIKVSW